VGQEIRLGDDGHVRLGEDRRVLERLVLALADRQQDHLEVLAEVIGGRADEVADVLDEQDVGGHQLRLVEGGVDLPGVEVAGAARQDLVSRHPERADAIGIAFGGDVPFDHCAAMAVLESADGGLEQRRLARAR